jgi:flagellin
MSSLLTNTSAMVALQTLKTINKGLGDVQNQISTGKRIANARDNAALWGISTTMQTDVSGFKAISESLSLGDASLTVARDAAETITSLLDQLKGKIVASQEENVDRTKIQRDVQALKDQIGTVVSGAQFNGLNLLTGSEDVEILASLNRDAAGTVTDSKITIARQDLSQTAGTYNTAGTAITGASVSGATVNGAKTQTATVTIAGTIVAAENFSFTLAGETIAYAAAAATVTDVAGGLKDAINGNLNLQKLGITAANTAGVLTITSTNAFEAYTAAANTTNSAAGTIALTDAALEAGAETATFTGRTVKEGDGYRITLGGRDYDYVARDSDTLNSVGSALLAKMRADTDNAAFEFKLTLATNPSSGADSIKIQADLKSGTASFAAESKDGGEIGGGLELLSLIDVDITGGPEAALGVIESLIQTSIDAAATIGSTQGRIETQSEFVSKIMDGLTAGIGTLVDADMEAASAKLQALQVQQQLGVQALSIANQAPQNILALFR